MLLLIPLYSPCCKKITVKDCLVSNMFCSCLLDVHAKYAVIAMTVPSNTRTVTDTAESGEHYQYQWLQYSSSLLLLVVC